MIDTLRALTVAANSLRFNPRIGIDTGEQYERVLTDLRDKLGREVKNDPLTLDELREMDGEPIYIMELHIGISYWAVIKDVQDSGIWLCTANDPADYASFYMYGMTWLAYRRKPEKGERA